MIADIKGYYKHRYCQDGNIHLQCSDSKFHSRHITQQMKHEETAQLTTVAFSGTEAVYGRWEKYGGVSCTSITLMIKSVLLFKLSPS